MNQQQTTTSNPILPDYLTSYDALAQHFRAQFEGLSTSAMGEKFARFVQLFIPMTDLGSTFKIPELREKNSRAMKALILLLIVRMEHQFFIFRLSFGLIVQKR